jgi:hypothetical protein
MGETHGPPLPPVLQLRPHLPQHDKLNNNNNTIALLNLSTKAGNLRWGVMFPLLVWLAFEDGGYAIHGLAEITFALHSSTNLALAYTHSTLS